MLFIVWQIVEHHVLVVDNKTNLAECPHKIDMTINTMMLPNTASCVLCVLGLCTVYYVYCVMCTLATQRRRPATISLLQLLFEITP